MLDNYRHYFDIDPEYFPQVNEAIINKNPDIWKKYYPHETFVKLIKDTVSVLSRQQKLSIWVEGAYGTGKSHAVLTLKKLLDASEEDTKVYFFKYPDQLSNDLCNQLQRLKNDNKKIITVHRYGSSNIHGDKNLVFAIQESIEQALRKNGIQNSGTNALKGATISWLSQPWAKEAVNSLIREKYSDKFGGDDVDAIIEKLRTFTGAPLITLMSKVSEIGEENNLKALSLDVNGLVTWIKEVIKENNLKAIVFIWDEFTNYFENNLRALTGFQQIVEISATDPFYMIIVTHKSAGLFSDTDKDQKRILDRFVKPTCNISLPENMAFRLMGSAMVKNSDPVVLEDWEETADELYDRTSDSRKLVKSKAGISDKELKNILPIHPYAALLLKHISSAFDSNQRSMFDFIKNDRGDEIKGFQWFIDNRGPEDENPLLTIDMLWDFFYEKGKEYLSADIRSILDCFSRARTKQLSNDEERVLKTTLLLQAISQRVGNSVELFIPDERNINNAFEGSDLDIGAAGRIAEKLCRDEVLYRKPLGGNKYQFSALINAGDMSAIEKLKEEIRKKTATALINEGSISEAINLGGALKLRYVIRFVSSTDFRTTVNTLRNQESNNIGKIMAVVAMAKDDSESATIAKMIRDFVADKSYHMIFIDASVTPLGKDTLEQYVEAMANAQYQRGKDNALAVQYEQNAKDALKKWRNRIASGEFDISYMSEDGHVVNERVSSVEHLCNSLVDINKKRFGSSLETGSSVIDNMWAANSLKSGVEYGASEITRGTFLSGNSQTKLENYIGADAWKQEEGSRPYWEAKPYLLISKIKLQVISTVEEAFQKEGRVSIAEVYDDLKAAPFGFLPCNLTAFVMGFVLKEYVDGTYSWSDGLTNDALTITKLKEMVSEVISLQITPNPRYHDKYIVMLTKEEKSFNEASSQIFNIPLNQCTNVEQTRERIRNEMKKLSFPIWSLKYVLVTSNLRTDVKKVDQLIDLYSGIANSQNIAGGQSDNDIAMNIGKLCIQNPGLADDLKSILTEPKCTEGMKTYLKEFEDGILLQLSDEIGDNGQYINVLKSKFDADAANWVWNQETAQQKIREVILEYRIIAESNKVISKTVSFRNTISEWCDKCSYIRISYPAAKAYLGDIGEFLDILHNMKKAGELLDSQKKRFYDLLTANMSAFKDFYNNQLDVFKEVCGFYIEPYDFTDDEIRDLYMSFPMNCFIREKSDYLSMVEAKVAEFNSSRGSARLKKLWLEKTGTVSPRVWSKDYKMPILCMIEDGQMQAAKEAFGTINRQKPDMASIDKALSFLETATFFDRLKSEKERDKAFRVNLIKDFYVMLTDIAEVKNYLNRVITADPYDWLGLPEVDKKLRQMAEAKYNQGGCDKALEKIDSMDIADVKRYLKDLIKDNMIVGMEIIKEN